MRLPLHLRLTSGLVLASYLNLVFPVVPLWAEINSPAPVNLARPAVVQAPAPVRTTAHVKVNRTLPKGVVQAVPDEYTFSALPADEEIMRAHILAEPLVPVGKSTTPAENAALAQAIMRDQKAGPDGDLAGFTEFLARHPDSAWAASLHLNLGLRYFAAAYFSKALVEYAAAWASSKSAADEHGHAVGDRAIGELLKLDARLGRVDVLEKLFKEIDGRVISGSATELVTGAKEGLWVMQHHPEVAFRCGPYALDRILAHQNKTVGFNPTLMASCSTQHGISLTEVWKLAKAAGLDYQMAKRTPGAAIIAPAVVNWKVGHYAAIISGQTGVYQLEDPTFGEAYSATQAALDAEASGYFLVPSGPLPSGWQPVNEAEGNTVWGKGQPNALDPSRTLSYDCKTCPHPPPPGPPPGMAVASGTLMVCSLNLMDTPLFYAPPKGPAVNFTLTYNQREASQPTTFDYGNVGNKWTHNWLSFIDEARSGSSGSYTYTPQVRAIGGGTEAYAASGSTADTDLGTSASYTFSTHQTDSQAQLTKNDANTYTIAYPDGSSLVYGFRTGAAGSRRYFLTQIIDPTGNGLTLSYDGSSRLVAVTDALGQVTTLSYGLSGDTLKVTEVTDPFGRTAQLNYDSSGHLSQITDMIGLTSQFAYLPGSDFINTLTTAYGISTFAYSENGLKRTLNMTDPLGDTERVEFWDDAGSNYPAVGTQPVGMSTTGSYDNYRSTFYWNKRAYASWPDVNAAHAYHWLHTASGGASGHLENEKSALEANRVWYNYPGQTGPYYEGTSGNLTAVGRVLDNGDTQLCQYAYNSFGKVTSATTKGLTSGSTTVLSRETDYVYDTNSIDLLTIKQKNGSSNDVLAAYTYNSHHQPLTVTDAAGETTTYTYYTSGQIHTITNAKSQVTTFTYDSNGYLTQIAGPVSGATTTFAYDSYGRVHTVTDSESYTVTTAYDALNRPTTVTFPDGTTALNVYDKLDLAGQVDRLGRATEYRHNPLRQLTQMTDALGRITKYDWCGCGALSSLTDPAGNTTNFSYDVQGRMTGKQYADSHGYTYAYETDSSRLKSVTDALSQRTNYTYNDDDTLYQVTYTDTSGSALSPATPTVTYTYDSIYPRLATMVDGTGTTTYGYNAITTTATLGAGMLATIDGPLANDTIAYTYDELGRVLTQSINGSANTSTMVYDTLGRTSSVTNPLGEFDYSYVNQTGRLDHIVYPNSQRTNYSYYPNSATTPGNDDQRLSQIQNLVASGGANLSTFGYTYDANGIIQTWSKQIDTASALTSTFTYDAADQLKTAVVPASSSVSTTYRYLYDKGSNRTSEQIGSAAAAATVNNLNQATAFSSTGPIHFAGSLSEPATVTVNGQATPVDSSNNFSADVPLAPGTHTVAVVATDGSSNARTKHYSVTVADSGATRTLTYDLDGNLTNNGAGQTYAWDAANRLTKITYADSSTTEFTYDGVGQRVKIVEKNSSGTTISDKRFVWCGGAQPCEERDSSNTVTKRFYDLGEQIGSTSYYFTTDHLGSVREMTDGSAVVQARYDYDPYGRRTKVSGSLDADFGFTGDYYHTTSGLDLTLYRAYDANLGRWLSRDPVAEKGGINLYAYVGNNPIDRIDLLGLWNTAGPVPDGTKESTIMTDGKGGIKIYYGRDPLLRIPVIKESVTIHEGSHRIDALNEKNAIGSDKDSGNPLPEGIRINATGTVQAAISEIDATVRQQRFLDKVLANPEKYNVDPNDIEDIRWYDNTFLSNYLVENYDKLKACP